MHSYRVVESCVDGSRLALHCHMGRYHVVRTLNEMPVQGVVLKGDRPHLGFGILLCASSGAVLRVIFESINDTDLSYGGRWMQNTSPNLQVSTFGALTENIWIG